MKIAILGAGAMGSLYGGLLSQKNEVYLIDIWQEHVEQINKNGLIIQTAKEEKSTVLSSNQRCSSRSCGFGHYFCEIRPHRHGACTKPRTFAEHTIALTLQNGYGNDRISSLAAGG